MSEIRPLSKLSSRLYWPAALALTLAACPAPKSVPALPAHLVVDDGVYLFDTVMGPPAQHQFKFTNDGGSTSQPLTVSLTGDLTNFAIVDDNCQGTKLGATGGCLITVALSSPTSGSFMGELHLSDGNSTVDVVMSGSVAPASLVVTSPSTGSVPAGSTTPAAVYTVRNAGGATSGALSVSVSPGQTTTDNCSGTELAGGATCTFSGDASTAINDSGSVTITGSASGSPGGAAYAEVTFAIVPPATLQVTSVNFGSADPLFAIAEVTVTNPGTVPTGALSVTVAGSGTPATSGAAFIGAAGRDLCSGVSLGAGQSCTIAIQPANDAARSGGVYSGTVTVSSPATHPGSGTIALTTIINHIGVSLSFAGAGSGSIQLLGSTLCSSSQDPPNCGIVIENGDSLTFTAVPAAGSVFGGWTGACTGTSPSCTITAANNVDVSLQATFN